MDKALILVKLLRSQEDKPSWYRDVGLYKQAANMIAKQRENLSLNNEFFHVQIKTASEYNVKLKTEIAALKQQLKISELKPYYDN